MTTILGVSCRSHDAAVSVVADGEILFATHCERYSRRKNDAQLAPAAIEEAMRYVDRIDEIAYYERDWLKRTRQGYAGQWRRAIGEPSVRSYLRRFPRLRHIPVHAVGHHEAHAAGAYRTSGFTDALVVVADAIGEWDTVSVWDARGDALRRVGLVRYPHSVGLLYSALTDRAGLRPNEEEYILMGLAAFGSGALTDVLWDDLVASDAWPDFRLTRNVHRGMRW